MRLLILVLACAAATEAQIVSLELDGGKAQAKYPAFSIVREGHTVILGEVLAGVDFDASKEHVNKPASAKKIVILVPDSARPELQLSEADSKGGRKVLVKQRVAEVVASDIRQGGIRVLFRDQNLAGLRNEYLLKTASLNARRETLKPLKPGTPEWYAEHRPILVEVDALIGWLRSTAFPEAAARLEREFGAELKKAGEVASAARLGAAKVLRGVDVPPDLLAKSTEIGQRDLGWHGRQTQHLRIVSIRDISEPQIDGAILLGERIIESFRTRFVEPYLGPGEADPIPEGQFQEFFLAPEDQVVGTRFLEEYYGQPLYPPRERSIQVAGHRRRKAREADYLHFARYSASRDLEGTVAHSLGHTLANIVFNGSRTQNPPDWIAEGFAYWVSFDHLSRNTDPCFAFASPLAGTYGRTATEVKEGLKVTETGLRAAFNELALEKGPDLARLVRISLVEMEAADLAKSWSWLDFLISAHPARLGPFLRACCELTDASGKTDVEGLRAKAEAIFGAQPGKDVYSALDEEWRKFAKTVQKGGDRRTGR